MKNLLEIIDTNNEPNILQTMKMRGGKRQGSGRPKGNEATKVVSFRLPISAIPEIKEQIKNYLIYLKQ